MKWMALFGFAAAACSSQVCDVPVSCPSGNGSYYTFCSEGGSSCYYSGTDGSKFNCQSCGTCADAKQLAEAWCTTAPAVPTTTGTSGGRMSSSGGASGGTSGNTTPTEQCSSSLCPSGSGSYKFCSTGATSCKYVTADFSTFNCTTCTNCTTAVQEVVNWCNTNGGTTNGTTNGTSGGTSDASCTGTGSITTCQSCCQGHHPQAAAYIAQNLVPCACAACPACSTVTTCGGSSSTTTQACSTCLSGTINGACSNVIQTCVQTIPDCGQAEICLNNCVNNP